MAKLSKRDRLRNLRQSLDRMSPAAVLRFERDLPQIIARIKVEGFLKKIKLPVDIVADKPWKPGK